MDDAPQGFRRLCILLRSGFELCGTPGLDGAMLRRRTGFMKHETAFAYENGTVVLDGARGEFRVRPDDPEERLVQALKMKSIDRI